MLLYLTHSWDDPDRAGHPETHISARQITLHQAVCPVHSTIPVFPVQFLWQLPPQVAQEPVQLPWPSSICPVIMKFST